MHSPDSSTFKEAKNSGLWHRGTQHEFRHLAEANYGHRIGESCDKVIANMEQTNPEPRTELIGSPKIL